MGYQFLLEAGSVLRLGETPSVAVPVLFKGFSGEGVCSAVHLFMVEGAAAVGLHSQMLVPYKDVTEGCNFLASGPC